MSNAVRIAIAIFFSLPSLGAAVLPAGANLEIRLSVPTGSGVSHPGDPIKAAIIAPVYVEHRLIVPEGAQLSGEVESVNRLGLGLKYRTAGIAYRFDALEFPNGQVFPLAAEVLEVETARERVNAGFISGIYPTVNFSSGASVLISALSIEPHFAAPMLGIKFLIARSPDSEIYFPAGTELVLKVLTDLALPDLDSPSNSAFPLKRNEVENARRLLNALPRQQTDQGWNRRSDLVNILVLGNRDQIGRAFQAAGWMGEQRHSALALYRMYHCLVERMGYATAPMGRLMLNGRAPDALYQKSLDTFSKRHHIRVWNQEQSNVWLGAGTEDVAYRFRRMHWTHATNPQIDNERAKIVNDLWITGCVDRGSLIERESLKPTNQNGTSIETDGRVAALRLNDCRIPRLNLASPGTSRPRARIVQGLAIVGKDLARSNPVSLLWSALRSFHDSDSQGPQTGALSRSDTQRAMNSKSLAPYTWKRPSVLDDNGGEPHSLN